MASPAGADRAPTADRPMPVDDTPRGLVAVGTVGLVWLSGEDRLAFLHRLTTNRLDDLAPGTGRGTLLLTDTGRVVDDLSCHHTDDGTALVTSHPSAAPIVAAHLRRYVLRDKVRITDATDQVVVHRLLGAGARAAVAVLLDVPPAAPPGAFFRGGDDAASIWALRHVWPWDESGWDVVVPVGSPAALASACAAAGLVAATDEDVTRWRIRRWIPRYGAEIDGTANPHELGLTALVDGAKGCYVGQEVVARLETYRKVQRRLVEVRGEPPLAAGDALTAAGVAAGPTGRRAARGVVTSAAGLGTTVRALALVPAAWEPDAAPDLVDPHGHGVAIVSPTNDAPGEVAGASRRGLT